MLGYIFSFEYLRDMNDEKRYLFAHSQAAFYLALPFSFHICSILSILTALLLHLPKSILFILFLVSSLIALYIYTRHFERKYPAVILHDEVLSTSKQQKKTALRFSMLFFIFNILSFIFIEIPLIFLI